MRIMLAPDSFKESLSAQAAVEAMADGIERINSKDQDEARPKIKVDRCPISDGGEGFLDTMLAATGGRRVVSQVTGPLGQPIEAAWGLIHNDTTAVIEMAQAAGLELVSLSQRDPTRTTTHGVGELIVNAMDRGVESILLGLGGSATNDGGTGMAQALGYRFVDQAGNLMREPLCGGRLDQIKTIHLEGAHPGLARCFIHTACDVDNPLFGPRGAAVVYGPQKGATPEQVQQLDAGLKHLAGLLERTFGRQSGHALRGAGAAGGMGAGVVSFCRADLTPGIGLVLDFVEIDERLKSCDLCLTGEGRLDEQSFAGKAVLQVAEAAKLCGGVPTIALVGSVSEDARSGLKGELIACHEIGAGLPLEEAKRRAAELLANHTEIVVRDWLAQRGA
ncbi:MAG: glycerate kinase [Planctomycetota bacterium]